MFLKSLLLVALLAVHGKETAATSNDFILVPRSCSNDTSVASFGDGRAHTYSFNSFTNFLDPKTTKNVRLTVTGKAIISSFQNCQHSIKLEDVEIPSTEVTNPTEIVNDLNDAELPFSFDNGVVTRVYPESSAAPWITNIQKALLSALQVSHGESSGATFMEDDILGKCETTFKKSGKTIEKTKNFARCEKRVQSSWMPVAERLLNEPYNPLIKKHEYRCTQTLGAGSVAVSKVECYEMMDLNGELLASEGTHFIRESRLSMNWMETNSADNGQLRVLETQDRKVAPLTGLTPEREAIGSSSQARNVLLNLCKRLNSNTMEEIPSLYTELVRVIRPLDFESLRELWTSVRVNGKVRDCSSPKLVDLLMDAIGGAGTGASLRVLLELSSSQDITSSRIDSMLLSLALQQRPREDIIEAMVPLLRKPTSPDSVFLRTSAILGHYCDSNSCPNPLSMSVLEAVSSHIDCAAPDPRATMLLLSIGNTKVRLDGERQKNSRTAQRITECASNKILPVATRVAALKAAEESSLCSVNRSMESTFIGKILMDNSEDDEVRINAFRTMLFCMKDSPSSILRNVHTVFDMNTSSSLRSYISTMMNQLAEEKSTRSNQARERFHEEIEIFKKNGAWKFTEQEDAPLTRHIEGSMDLPGAAGLAFELDVIVPRSQGYSVPTSVTVRIEVPEISDSISWLEVGFAQRGLTGSSLSEASLQGMIKKLIDSRTEIYNKYLRNGITSVESLGELQDKLRSLFASLDSSLVYVKYHGNTLLILDQSNVQDKLGSGLERVHNWMQRDTLPRLMFNVQGLLDALSGSLVTQDCAGGYSLMESVMEIPTVSGIGMKVNFDKTLVVGDRRKVNSRTDNNIDADWWPSMSLLVQGRWSMKLGTQTASLDVKRLIYSNLGFGMKMVMNDQGRQTFTIRMLEPEMKLIAARAVSYMESPPSGKTSLYDDSNDDRTNVPTLANFMGVDLGYSIAKSSGDFILPVGDVSLKRESGQEGWMVWIQLPDNKSPTFEGRLGFDTPGSAESRKHEIVLKGTMEGMVKLRMEVSMPSGENVGEIKIDSKRLPNDAVQFVPKVMVSFSDGSRKDYEGKVTVNQRGSRGFKVSSELYDVSNGLRLRFFKTEVGSELGSSSSKNLKYTINSAIGGPKYNQWLNLGLTFVLNSHLSLTSFVNYKTKSMPSTESFTLNTKFADKSVGEMVAYETMFEALSTQRSDLNIHFDQNLKSKAGELYERNMNIQWGPNFEDPKKQLETRASWTTNGDKEELKYALRFGPRDWNYELSGEQELTSSQLKQNFVLVNIDQPSRQHHVDLAAAIQQKHPLKQTLNIEYKLLDGSSEEMKRSLDYEFNEGDSNSFEIRGSMQKQDKGQDVQGLSMNAKIEHQFKKMNLIVKDLDDERRGNPSMVEFVHDCHQRTSANGKLKFGTVQVYNYDMSRTLNDGKVNFNLLMGTDHRLVIDLQDTKFTDSPNAKRWRDEPSIRKVSIDWNCPMIVMTTDMDMDSNGLGEMKLTSSARSARNDKKLYDLNAVESGDLMSMTLDTESMTARIANHAENQQQVSNKFGDVFIKSQCKRTDRVHQVELTYPTESNDGRMRFEIKSSVNGQEPDMRFAIGGKDWLDEVTLKNAKLGHYSFVNKAVGRRSELNLTGMRNSNGFSLSIVQDGDQRQTDGAFSIVSSKNPEKLVDVKYMNSYPSGPTSQTQLTIAINGPEHSMKLEENVQNFNEMFYKIELKNREKYANLDMKMSSDSKKQMNFDLVMGSGEDSKSELHGNYDGIKTALLTFDCPVASGSAEATFLVRRWLRDISWKVRSKRIPYEHSFSLSMKPSRSLLKTSTKHGQEELLLLDGVIQKKAESTLSFQIGKVMGTVRMDTRTKGRILASVDGKSSDRDESIIGTVLLSKNLLKADVKKNVDRNSVDLFVGQIESNDENLINADLKSTLGSFALRVERPAKNIFAVRKLEVLVSPQGLSSGLKWTGAWLGAKHVAEFEIWRRNEKIISGTRSFTWSPNAPEYWPLEDFSFAATGLGHKLNIDETYPWPFYTSVIELKKGGQLVGGFYNHFKKLDGGDSRAFTTRAVIGASEYGAEVKVELDDPDKKYDLQFAYSLAHHKFVHKWTISVEDAENNAMPNIIVDLERWIEQAGGTNSGKTKLRLTLRQHDFSLDFRRPGVLSKPMLLKFHHERENGVDHLLASLDYSENSANKLIFSSKTSDAEIELRLRTQDERLDAKLNVPLKVDESTRSMDFYWKNRLGSTTHLFDRINVEKRSDGTSIITRDMNILDRYKMQTFASSTDGVMNIWTNYLETSASWTHNEAFRLDRNTGCMEYNRTNAKIPNDQGVLRICVPKGTTPIGGDYIKLQVILPTAEYPDILTMEAKRHADGTLINLSWDEEAIQAEMMEFAQDLDQMKIRRTEQYKEIRREIAHMLETLNPFFEEFIQPVVKATGRDYRIAVRDVIQDIEQMESRIPQAIRDMMRSSSSRVRRSAKIQPVRSVVEFLKNEFNVRVMKMDLEEGELQLLFKNFVPKNAPWMWIWKYAV